VDRIAKWPWVWNGVLGSAVLLLPLSATPESHVQAPTASSTTSAIAHVDFKIIIPKVLYLGVPDTDAPGARVSNTVAVMSNSHNVALTATVRSATGTVAGNVILSAAARKTVAQDAVCAAAGFAASANRVICTVSMP
jgi:hypothetical protein